MLTGVSPPADVVVGSTGAPASVGPGGDVLNWYKLAARRGGKLSTCSSHMHRIVAGGMDGITTCTTHIGEALLKMRTTVYCLSSRRVCFSVHWDKCGGNIIN